MKRNLYLLAIVGALVFSLAGLTGCDAMDDLFGSDDEDDFELSIGGEVVFAENGSHAKTVDVDFRLLWKDTDEPRDEPDQARGSLEIGGTSYAVADLMNVIDPILGKLGREHGEAISEFESLSPDQQWAFRVVLIIHGVMEEALPPTTSDGSLSGITADIDEEAMEGLITLEEFPKNLDAWDSPDDWEEGTSWSDFLGPFVGVENDGDPTIACWGMLSLAGRKR